MPITALIIISMPCSPKIRSIRRCYGSAIGHTDEHAGCAGYLLLWMPGSLETNLLTEL